jgi:photosystem II stability/assembly factor-like uncharacterized protein
MAVLRIAALSVLAATSVGSSAAASHSAGSEPNTWRTYELIDVRNAGSPVAMIELRHRRIGGDSVSIRTHLLLRAARHWRDATPRGLKWGIEDAYFVDRRNGWLVTNDCAAAKGAMYRTRDGGQTWRRLPWGFTHGCASGSGFRLVFVDRQHGWVIAPSPTAPRGGIFRTADAGRTWAYNDVSPTGVPVLDDAVFTTARTGWAIGLSWLHTGPLYKTSDSGRTWKPDSRLPQARYSVPAFFGDIGIVMGRRHGVATFYRTANAGRSWAAVDRLDVHDLRFPDFRAPTDRNWWVFGVRGATSVVIMTTDRGRSWTRKSPPGRAYYVQFAATGKRSWLTATPLEGQGALFSSGDMGRTWTRVTP